MTEQYIPRITPPNGVYGPEFWDVVREDFTQFIWNTITLKLTKKVPPYNFLEIRWCGNPQCNSPIRFYSNELPPTCDACNKKINWG
jgi:hypothetical protein